MLYVAPSNSTNIQRDVRPVDNLVPIGTPRFPNVPPRWCCINTPPTIHPGSSCIQQNDIIPDGTLLSTTPSYTPTFAGCCAACSANTKCNAFAYCQPGVGSCTIPTGSVGAGVYNETSCLLFYQQALELPGNGIKAATFTTNVVVNFVAGAPVGAITIPTTMVDGYAPYALARLAADVGVLQTCGGSGNATCMVTNATVEVFGCGGDAIMCVDMPHVLSTLMSLFHVLHRMQQLHVTPPPFVLPLNTSPPQPPPDSLASLPSTPHSNCAYCSTTISNNPLLPNST